MVTLSHGGHDRWLREGFWVGETREKHKDMLFSLSAFCLKCRVSEKRRSVFFIALKKLVEAKEI